MHAQLRERKACVDVGCEQMRFSWTVDGATNAAKTSQGGATKGPPRTLKVVLSNPKWRCAVLNEKGREGLYAPHSELLSCTEKSHTSCSE